MVVVAVLVDELDDIDLLDVVDEDVTGDEDVIGDEDGLDSVSDGVREDALLALFWALTVGAAVVTVLVDVGCVTVVTVCVGMLAVVVGA